MRRFSGILPRMFRSTRTRRCGAGAVLLAVAACGGATASDLFDGQPRSDASVDGAADVAAPDPDAAPEPTDGAPSDAKPLADAAADAGKDAAPAATLACGSLSCKLPAQFCCETDSFSFDAGGFVLSHACASGFSCGGTAIRCYSESDCSKGEVCCFASYGAGMGTLPASQCRAGSCGYAEVQGCATAAECSGCAARTCSNGESISTCAPIYGVCN